MNEIHEQLLEQFTHFERLAHRYQRRHLHGRGPGGPGPGGPGVGGPGGGGPGRGPLHNPHRGQGRVLSILKLQPEIPQRELGYLLDMSKQSLAEILGKLERAELIARTPSEKDRRAHIIVLTEKGKAMLDEEATRAQQSEENLASIFDCLTAEEQQNLNDYLTRIIAHMEEHFSDNGDERAELYRSRFFADHGVDDERWMGEGRGRGRGRRGEGRGERGFEGRGGPGGRDGRGGPRGRGGCGEGEDGGFEARGGYRAGHRFPEPGEDSPRDRSDGDFPTEPGDPRMRRWAGRRRGRRYY